MSPLQPMPNPYAPPTAGGALRQPSQGRFYVEGALLLVENGAVLPPICVLTGNRELDNDHRTHKKFHWVKPWVGIFALISPLIYLILYMVLRKSGEFSYSMSAEAKKRRTTGIALMIGGIVLGLLAVLIGGNNDMPALLGLGAVVIIVGILVGALMVTPFRIQKIDEQYLHVKLKPDALQAFVDHLRVAPPTLGPPGAVPQAGVMPQGGFGSATPNASGYGPTGRGH